MFKLKFRLLLIRIFILGIGIAIDSFFHGDILISWYNFFLYNVYHNIGVHYGTHPWHWYLTEGFPTIIFTNLVLFLFGLKLYKKLYFPISAVFFNIFAYR